jgi:hypothetical protein
MIARIWHGAPPGIQKRRVPSSQSGIFLPTVREHGSEIPRLWVINRKSGRFDLLNGSVQL